VTENEELARRLRSARNMGTRLPPTEAPTLDVAAGHAVQVAGRALCAAAGEGVAGRKVGLTSARAQRAMAVSEPVSGYLLDSAILAAGAEFDCAGLVAPRVEIEVAFVLARALEGPNVTATDVLDATAHLALALEVVDSRWEGGAPGVGALLADDVSAAAVIVGREVDPAADLSGLRVTARIGENAAAGDAGNVLGDPTRAVAWLCADLHRRGERLEAGDLVLSGALCGPTPVRSGDVVRADFEGWGHLETRFVGRPDERA
jgi:2-keto-4-pentenoate hydratase